MGREIESAQLDLLFQSVMHRDINEYSDHQLEVTLHTLSYLYFKLSDQSREVVNQILNKQAAVTEELKQRLWSEEIWARESL